jgi:tetratricopeptide (TPR) repeat protein
VKKTAYAGLGLSIAGTIIEPLTVFAETTLGPRGDEGMDAIFESIYRIVLKNPYKDSNASQLVKLADLNIRYGNVCEGASLMFEAEKTARCCESSISCASVLNEMAKAYYNAGREEVASYAAREAFAILSGEIKNGKDKDYAGIQIVSNAKMLGRIGEREKALRRLDEWYKHNSENRIVSRCLARAYIELEQYDKANAIAHHIPDTPDTLQKIRGMAEIADELADAGQMDMAHRLISLAMVYRNQNPRKQAVAEDISSAYAKLGEWDKAFEIADEAGFENSYFRIATHAVKTGNMEMAEKAAFPKLLDMMTESDERYLFKLSYPEVAELFWSIKDYWHAFECEIRSIQYLKEKAQVGEYWKVREYCKFASFYSDKTIGVDGHNYAKSFLCKAFAEVISERDIVSKADELLMIAGTYVKNRIEVGEKELSYAKDIVASCDAA